MFKAFSILYDILVWNIEFFFYRSRILNFRGKYKTSNTISDYPYATNIYKLILQTDRSHTSTNTTFQMK
jgi:hypothetical protein